MSPTRLLVREVRSSGRNGVGQNERQETEESETAYLKQKQMCATTVDSEKPIKGAVKVVRMSRGRRMSEETFNSLPEKEKIRVLRNRRNALQTRARRQRRIKTLTKENALLEASVALKQKQIAVLLSLLGGNVNVKSEDQTSQ